MTTAQGHPARPALTARIIHAALAGGCVLFGVLNYFVIRPQRTDSLPEPVRYALLGVSVSAGLLSYLALRRRIPLKSSNESADLFWTRAFAPALITWSLMEAGAVVALVAYMLDGSAIALGIAAVAVAGLILLAPGRIERA